jgi:uncharacterized protein (DUF2062 family)
MMKRQRQLKQRIQEKLSQLTIARLRQMPQEVRGQWEELLETGATPGSVAGAFAAGTFISALPVPMLELVAFLVVSRFVSKPKRLPLLTAQAMWNSVVMAPLYAVSPKVGQVVVEAAANRGVISAAPMNGSWLVGVVAGNLVIAGLLTAASYAVVRVGYGRYQRKLTIDN